MAKDPMEAKKARLAKSGWIIREDNLHNYIDRRLRAITEQYALELSEFVGVAIGELVKQRVIAVPNGDAEVAIGRLRHAHRAALELFQKRVPLDTIGATPSELDGLERDARYTFPLLHGMLRALRPEGIEESIYAYLDRMYEEAWESDARASGAIGDDDDDTHYIIR